MSQPTVSFEFFPPKTEKAAETLWEAVPLLAAFAPLYMTVTYGAGGSTRDGTVDTIVRMAQETNIPVGAHLTFINTPKDQLHEFTSALWAAGIRHLIALRGDMPPDLHWPLDPDKEYFQYTSDFVEGLKRWHDFEISVGCYPEKHPDAKTPEDDIRALKLKCDAGADRAITQFFFDNDIYYRFVEKCRKAGIATPICPGLLPIHDFKSVSSFAARCQAHIPEWLIARFDGLEDKPEEAQKVATELLVRQSQDLAAQGVEHIHYYCMNKAPITTEAVQSLGYANDGQIRGIAKPLKAS
ncbi:MAG: methylenetetrahydrofolate reductase [NAD(P)H] [Alphaproteobacteria bacterium]|nr:methylenetetrahydrofolate reductase [NAD(P)H] [Alphaproteobacteria bacterium]